VSKSSVDLQSSSTNNNVIRDGTSDLVETSVNDRHHHRQNEPVPNKGLCTILKNYFTERQHIDARWSISDDRKAYQITFSIEFGLVSDRILQDLLEIGIGTMSNTRIVVLPTLVLLDGHEPNENRVVSTHTEIEPIVNINSEKFVSSSSTARRPETGDGNVSLTYSIRQRVNESNFKKSVRARLMFHQVITRIRASTALSFDFILFIFLASMLAAFGLLENSTVVIVASMLVSPLMDPILGIVFGLSIHEHSMWRRGLRNELLGLSLCISCGLIIG
jgi:hypothetical protein